LGPPRSDRSGGSPLTRRCRPGQRARARRDEIARDELYEEAVQALIRCHVAIGERAQALRVYRRFSEQLLRELEAEPHDETIRLAQRLQEGVSI
jgi:hypothetical protein